MGRNVGSVEIDIKGDNAHFRREWSSTQRDIRTGNQAIRGDFRRTAAEADRVGNSIKGIRTSMVALAATAGLGLAASVNTLKDFGQAMSTVQAVSGATEAQLAAMTAEARRLGATTRYSATEAAEGLIYLSRAGYTANEALMAVEGTLTLAQAGNLELGRAADIASNVLGGFNMRADQTARVVDVLAKAANSSNTTVESLGEALKYAAPAASALGLSLEETVATIGKLGDSGIQGGLGGRGFNAIVTQFLTKKDEIEGIIGTFDLAEEGLTKVIRRLKEAGITTEQVVKIFRGENLDVFTVLANASVDAAKGTEVLNDKLLKAGQYSKTASAIMDDNLNGAIKATVSALQEVILKLGELGAEDTLIAGFRGMTSLLRAAAENADLLAVAAVALSARALIPLAIRAVPAAIMALRELAFTAALTAQRVGVASAAMAAVGGPWTIAITAAAAAYLYLANEAEKARKRTERATSAFEENKKILQETADLVTGNDGPFDAITEGAEDAANKVADLTDAVQLLADGMKNLREESQIATGLQLQARITATKESIDELEAARAKARYESTRLNARGEFAINPQALENFDQSEEGKRLVQLKQQLAALEIRQKNALQGVTLQDAIDQFLGKKPETDDEVKPKRQLTDEEKKRLAVQKELRLELEWERKLQLAQITGNEEMIKKLERQKALRELIADLTEAGYKDAEERAEAQLALEEEITEQVRIRNRAELTGGQKNRNSQGANNGVRGGISRDEMEKEKEAFRKVFGDAVEEAMASGNVGNAIKSVFAERVRDGMREALDNLADAIYELFRGVFNGMNGQSSGGGGLLSGIGSFLGKVITGGNLFSGTTSAVASLAGPHSGAGQLSGLAAAMGATNIYIEGNADQKTLSIMDQKLAEHRAALPGAIDARVNNQIKRGAYGG